MLHICCVRAGDRFSPAYVNILFDSVRRNLADGFEGEFVCFTDQPDDLDKGIKVRPLPHDLPGWWSKLGLFKPGVFPEGDRVLYFDLGCVITGRLDEIAAYDGPFAILRDFYRPDGMQSAVMAWQAGLVDDKWDAYALAGLPQDFTYGGTWGDQAWIESVQPEAVRLQDVFPGAFASFKQIAGPPEKASVVVFHGYPKPDDIANGWVPEVWKIGGMTRAELDVVCNVERDRIMGQVESTCARDLLWFDTEDEHDGHVCLVGGGPSLKDTLPELQWRQSIGQKVWALNGAGKFLLRNGVTPDVVVIADARPENASFLNELSPSVTAALASQCHPDVFDRALGRGMRVIVWHANSPGMRDYLQSENERPVHLIGGGSTVGMNAMVLAFAAGYREIHLYGYDSSYRDDAHHAYRQMLNESDRIIDALYRDKKFKTAAWMAQQVNDFQALAPVLIADGCTITIAGDGLLPAVADDLLVLRPPTPAQIRAQEVLQRAEGARRGAEIGVFAGEMSAALLKGNPDLHLDMIDSWESDGKAYHGNSGDFHAGLSQAEQDHFFKSACDRTKFANGRHRIIRGRSVQAAKYLQGPYDFVFIDADHSYEGCKADIDAWAGKVKPGGLLAGHDYENHDYPQFGVKRAVDEFVTATGFSLSLGENFCWFIQIPASPQTEKNYG